MARNRILALVVVLATVLFAIGAGVENSDTHAEPAGETHLEGEVAESGEEAEHAEGAESAEGEAGKEDETLLGVDVESTPLVVLAIVASLALAACAWLRPDLGGLIAVAMLVFAALDVREVAHQLDESEGGIALLAGIVAALHFTAAALAFRLARTGPPPA